MNTTGKVIVGIIVLVVVLGGAFYLYQQMQPTPVVAPSIATTSQTSSAGTPATSQQTAASVNPLPSGTATSDAALAQDAASVDTQMSALSSDNTQVTQSVNDQPVTQ